MIATFKYVHSYLPQFFLYTVMHKITVRILEIENFIWQWYRIGNAELLLLIKI